MKSVVAPSLPREKKKILVIGGGTGLTTAYMLENMSDFDVTLVEKSSRLGGHINSFDFGDHGIAEGGAEFIGSPESYPNFHKLCRRLRVSLEKFELNADFHKVSIQNGGDNILLPPVYNRTAKADETVGCFSRLFGSRNKKQSKTVLAFNSLMTHLSDFIALQWTILHAQHRSAPQTIEEVETLEQFVEKFKQYPACIGMNIDKFADRVLYPLVAASWGIVMSEAKQMCAHYALNYISLSKDWYDAPAGLSSYMAAMEARCGKLHIKKETEIVKLIRVGEGLKYQALLSDNTLLMGDDGKSAVFDDVVISTPAYATVSMLPDIDPQEMANLKVALHAVRYYPTTVVLHTDTTYETPNETVIHTRVEGDYASNTAQKDWKAKNGATAVMKTWVQPGQVMPAQDKILQVCHYQHPYMDKAYFIAQQALYDMQEKYNLNFGGIMAGLGDSHEDATIAALKVAKAICAKYKCLDRNKRLGAFLDENGNVLERNSQLSSHEEERAAPSLAMS
ncbi:MAG: FAD-dependent oxidoreductase [Gammaproteobacteria bacterium]